MTITVYGIPNCDRIKKTLAWFAARGIAVDFHDYKKRGIDNTTLRAWSKTIDWSALVNRAGTTWRKLPDDVRASINTADSAVAALVANPSMMKRPVVVAGATVQVGFDAAAFESLLTKFVAKRAS